MNPFAEHGGLPVQKVSTNPFSEPPINPFTPPLSFQPVPGISSSLRKQVLKLSPLERSTSSLQSAVSSLKHVVVNHDLVILVCELPNHEAIVSRREIPSFHARFDGSFAFQRDPVHGLFINPQGTLVVLQRVQSRDVYICNAQDGVLKYRGPLPAFQKINSLIACVSWTGEHDAVVGLANGGVHRVTFSVLGVNAECRHLFSLSSPLAQVIVQGESNRLVACTQNGLLALWESNLLVKEMAHSMIVLDMLVDEDDSNLYWILSRNGLFRFSVLENEMVQVWHQANCFALSHSRLYLLVLSKQATKQSTVVSVFLHAISRISPSFVLDKPQPVTILGGNPFGFSRDAALNKVWLVGSQGLSLIEVEHELANVWKLYLEKGMSKAGREVDFQLALDFSTQTRHRDSVFAAQAEWHFLQGNFLRSAELFAEVRSQKTFEDIALKFSSLQVPLRVFLSGKLTRMQEQVETRKTLQVMLCTWIVELYLEELDRNLCTDPEVEMNFCSFLGSQSRVLDPIKEIIFHLLLSHGKTDLMLVFAYQMRDFERIIQHHIDQRAFLDATLALKEFNQLDLVYKFSAGLILMCPEILVADIWNHSPNIDALKLLPALSKFIEECQTKKENAALSVVIDFLQRHVGEEEVLHNLLLSAFMLGDEFQLMEYIRSQANRAGGPRFDFGFALRLCAKVSPQSQIALLDALNLSEAGITLSLELNLRNEVGIELARRASGSNRVLAKKLWTRLCADAYSKEGLLGAIQLSQRSEGVLSIEDVLGLVSDQIPLPVADLREDVCAALEKYSQEMVRLKQETEDHTHSSQLLRRDAREEKMRFDLVRVSRQCDGCGKRIFGKQQEECFVFPCTHVFHAPCLFNQVVSHLKGEQRERVSRWAVSKSPGDQALLEETIAASCPFCGELMLQSVAHPLLFAKDEAEARSWD